MRWKTAAFMVLLIFTASAFAVTSTMPVMADDSPSIYTYIRNFGRDFVRPCDPVGGGPGGPGD